MLRKREIKNNMKQQNYNEGRKEKNQNGVVCTQNGRSREFRYKW